MSVRIWIQIETGVWLRLWDWLWLWLRDQDWDWACLWLCFRVGFLSGYRRMASPGGCLPRVEFDFGGHAGLPKDAGQ